MRLPTRPVHVRGLAEKGFGGFHESFAERGVWVDAVGEVSRDGGGFNGDHTVVRTPTSGLAKLVLVDCDVGVTGRRRPVYGSVGFVAWKSTVSIARHRRGFVDCTRIYRSASINAIFRTGGKTEQPTS